MALTRPNPNSNLDLLSLTSESMRKEETLTPMVGRGCGGRRPPLFSTGGRVPHSPTFLD